MIFVKLPLLILLFVILIANGAFWLALAITGFFILGPVGLYCLGIMVASSEAILRSVSNILQW